MRHALVLCLVALACPASAQVGVPRPVEGPCLSTGGDDSCVRNVGCIGDDGRWFSGRALGWNAGEAFGRTSEGVLCRGRWAIQSDGRARASLTCEDGVTAETMSVYQDTETGTTIGEGVTSEGDRLRFWSGKHVLDFLTVDGRPVLPCGDDGIDLDADGVPIS